MNDTEALKELRELYEIAKSKKDVDQALKIYHMIRKLSRNQNLNNSGDYQELHDALEKTKTDRLTKKKAYEQG